MTHLLFVCVNRDKHNVTGRIYCASRKKRISQNTPDSADDHGHRKKSVTDGGQRHLSASNNNFNKYEM